MSSRVLSVFGGLLCLLAALLGPQNSSALAQNADDKPPDQQSTERNSVKEAQTVAEFAEAQAYSRGRLVIRHAFGWGGEWSVCSGATIWIPHSAISICTIGLAAPAIIYRRHSAVWS
jgi:hypothetical protein